MQTCSRCARSEALGELEAKLFASFLLALGSQLPKVLLNHVAVVGRKIVTDLLQGFLAVFGRQISPAARVANWLFRHFARPFLLDRHAIGQRGAGGGPPSALPRSRGRRLLLLFDFFDQFVERGDDTVFDLAHFWASPAQIEPS